MKSFIAPAVFLAAVVGINTLVPAPDVSEGEVAYSFNPGEIRRNICGPVGTNRGSLFRPDIAHLISSAVRADDAAMSESVPLLPGLDSRSFPISTKVPEAQAYYQQGAALLYGFNHWEAIRAFKKAQELDPTCAICHWGEAIAYGPNINAPMDAEGNKKAVAALEKAKALIANASERERDLIMALDTRYKAGAGADRGDMDQKFADAMAALHAKYPDDQDIATIYAEALMDTSPWDYWERDFTTPKPHIKTAIDAIEGVVAKNPDHYGAIHLFIHLYEASSVATKAEPYADKLAGLAPGSGHLVHMPGHIYFRIGRYLDSLETNVVAVKVDEDYLAMTKGSDLYRYGYYPHNVHFVLVSAQMAGDEAISLEYAKKLDALIPVQVVKEAEWIAPIKVAPYFVFAQFAPLDDVLAVEDRVTMSLTSRPCGTICAASRWRSAAMPARRLSRRPLMHLLPLALSAILAACPPRPFWSWRPSPLKGARNKLPVTMRARSHPSAVRSSCRTACPIWSRRSGTMRPSKALAPHSMKQANSAKPRTPSRPPLCGTPIAHGRSMAL